MASLEICEKFTEQYDKVHLHVEPNEILFHAAKYFSYETVVSGLFMQYSNYGVSGLSCIYIKPYLSRSSIFGHFAVFVRQILGYFKLPNKTDLSIFYFSIKADS